MNHNMGQTAAVTFWLFLRRLSAYEPGLVLAIRRAALFPNVEVDEPRGVAAEWRNDIYGDWYCYWDESYGMPADTVNDFVFKPPLDVARCGLVRTTDWNICAAATFKEVERQLARLFSIIQSYGASDYDRAIGHGDEGSGQ